ncbi:MAG TPA: hypothetical protein VL652_41900 [Kutzneria sp.]|nr:hypothetical protein [Kutzneria sp.]
MWTPRREPKQQPEGDDALGVSADSTLAETPVDPAAADGRDRRKVGTVALRTGAVVVAGLVVAFAVNQPQP